jgi:hypothetical protein
MLYASRPPGSFRASHPTPHAPRARSYLPPRPATNDQREAKKRLAPSSALPPFARLFSRLDDGHSITTPQQSAGSPRVHAGEHEDRTFSATYRCQFPQGTYQMLVHCLAGNEAQASSQS